MSAPRLTVVYSTDRSTPMVTRTWGEVRQLILWVPMGNDGRAVYALVRPMLDDGEAKWVRDAFGIDGETTST